jgi:beta-lactamase class C
MTVNTPIRPLAMATICFCLLPATLRAADAPKEITGAVSQAVGRLMKEYDVPGLAVAVTIDGQDYFFNFGVASKAARTPVTEDTLFEIGSVSKTFTAILAGYAQTLGKLSLDDHPSKFMPELRHSAIDATTLLNLGTFTAGGLPLQFPDDLRTEAEMKTYFRQWESSAKPGTQRQYSNPSIGLLGHITALAMKRPFTKLVETEIFPRLGLRHSYIHVPAAAMGDYAWGYSKAGKPIRVNPGMFDAEAYGIKSSATDMIRFVDANIRPDTLEEPVRRAVEETHVGYFKSGELVQGLGWEQYPYPVTLERLLAGNANTMTMDTHAATRLTPPRNGTDPTLFNKTGSTNGFSAYVAFVPAKKIGLVLLANKNVPIPARVIAGYAVLDELTRASGRFE